MKTIAKFGGREEAQIAVSFLESHGIHAYLPGSESLSVMPHLTFGITSYNLMVPDDEVEAAVKLLENLPEVTFDEEEIDAS